MSALQLSAGSEPDELDLELLALGVEATPAIRDHLLEAPALEPARAELAAWSAWWASMPRTLPAPVSPRRAGLRGWAAALAVALLVTAFLAVIPEREGVRPRGGLPVDLVALRNGAAVTGGLAAGDDLYVTFAADEAGFVSVLTVEEGGRVSLLAVGAPVAQGERFSLPGAARLDGSADPEWLIVRIDPVAPDAEELEALATAALPDPVSLRSGTVWVMEITRGRAP